MHDKLAEPWHSFLKEIDEFLGERVEIHCLGGFVVTQIYGAKRTTADIDTLTLVEDVSGLLELAGRGSKLHSRHKVYLDPVGIAKIPENYDDRLTEVFSENFSKLHLLVLDPYDLALAKIERNSERDRDDVKHLAKAVPFDLEILRERYNVELRHQLGIPEREDLTVQLWIEMIEEERDLDRILVRA